MKKAWIYSKNIAISGASGGLGFCIAKTLIEKYNCTVYAIARNEQKLLKAKASLKNLEDKFIPFIFDVNDKSAWLDFYNFLISNNIVLDVLINNAGFMLPFAKFEKLSDSEIEEIIKTNFVSHVNATKILLPLIKQSKTPAIINVSSSAGQCAVIGESMYCATKFAMRGFTETLTQEYKKQIYVAGIYPGFIKTDILNRMSIKDKENKLINRLMTPVDKATKKIIRKIIKKKKRIVLGVDGKSMTFFSRLFPKFTPSLVSTVLKSSKLELFSQVFEDKGGLQ